METLPEIDFQGMEPSADFRARIENRIGLFEKRYGRVTACRVVVKGPGGHHQAGGLYEINVHLVLPGGHEVAVERTPYVDDRYTDFDFALNDAFKRARRRLQDEVRRMQGQVKVRTKPIGVIRKLMRDDGYGFLESDDGREIYFHRNSVVDDEFGRLELGELVSFSEEEADRGPQATSVKPLGQRAPQ